MNQKRNILIIIIATFFVFSTNALAEESQGSGWSPDFDIDCSNGGLLNFLNKGDGICNSLGGFLDVLNNSFSFGGCSVDLGGGGNKCYLNKIESICSGASAKAGKYVTSPIRSAVNSVSEFEFLKGDGFKTSKMCDTSKKKSYEVKHRSGLTDKDIHEKTSAEVMMKKHIDIFSSRIDLVRDCLKEEGEKCLDDDIIELPADNQAAEKQIIEAAQTIAQADESSGADQAAVEVETKNKLTDCLRKPAEEQEICRKKVTEDKDTSPQSGATKAMAKLEMASAIELNVIKKATKGSTYYVYKSRDFIEQLPINIQHKYADGVARQNVADALIMSLYGEIVALKKEAIRANYANSEEISQPYTAQGGIDALMNKFDLNGKGWRGTEGDSNGPDSTSSGYSGTEVTDDAKDSQ